MTAAEILRHVDHTLLKATATWDDICTLAEEAVRYKTASVMIPPAFVAPVREAFGKKLVIGTVVGFPLGNTTTATKVAETEQAIFDGADEIDMVINIGWLKSGDEEAVIDEIQEVNEAAEGRILKVIVETCYLSEREKIAACRAVTAGGADYIKTSTGFGAAGADLADIALFKKHLGDKVKIKAAGGIKTRTAMEDFLRAGCHRLGMSGAIGILRAELEEGGTV